jgi:hypothetical protein
MMVYVTIDRYKVIVILVVLIARSSHVPTGTNAFVSNKYNTGRRRKVSSFIHPPLLLDYSRTTPKTSSLIGLFESTDANQGSSIPDISFYMPRDGALSTSAKWTNSTEINRITKILLDEESHSLALAQEDMESAMSVLYAWSKTNSIEGAQIVEQIVRRLEAESVHANSSLVNGRAYQLVCRFLIVDLL